MWHPHRSSASSIDLPIVREKTISKYQAFQNVHPSIREKMAAPASQKISKLENDQIRSYHSDMTWSF